MLRITTAEDPSATVLRLEGKLAGPWVKELEECWRSGAAPEGQRGLRIDLREVTFIDAAGKDLLTRLHRDGAELVAADCMTKAIIETITGGHRDVPCRFGLLSAHSLAAPPPS